MDFQTIRNNLKRVSESQESTIRAVRLQEENIGLLESAYSQQNNFLNELQGKWQEKEFGHYLIEARDELTYCQQKSMALVLDEMDELQQEKKQLVEKEEQLSESLRKVLNSPSENKEETKHVY